MALLFLSYLPPNTNYFQNILDKTMKLTHFISRSLYPSILDVFFLLILLIFLNCNRSSFLGGGGGSSIFFCFGVTITSKSFLLGPYLLLLDCFEHLPASPTSLLLFILLPSGVSIIKENHEVDAEYSRIFVAIKIASITRLIQSIYRARRPV